MWGENQDLSASLKDLTGSCFGCTPDRAFLFDNTKVKNYLWDNDKMCAGKDWLSGFLKINEDIALKESEGLSREREQTLKNNAVDDFFFSFMRNLFAALNIRDEPHVIFSIDETRFSFNNVLPKIVTTKSLKIL